MESVLMMIWHQDTIMADKGRVLFVRTTVHNYETNTRTFRITRPPVCWSWLQVLRRTEGQWWSDDYKQSRHPNKQPFVRINHRIMSWPAKGIVMIERVPIKIQAFSIRTSAKLRPFRPLSFLRFKCRSRMPTGTQLNSLRPSDVHMCQ